MNTMMIRKILSLLILVMLISACNIPETTSRGTQAPIASQTIADIIAKYREEIPQHMQQEKIPGLSIAVVDDQGILWSEGFGYTDWDRRTPVTPTTIFSIQSMSKSFTATAAMIAAQEGLVDLDAPITTYLPNFSVHSIFEEHPEQKMTLRILLSHTAGFPHDTTYGANYDHPATYSFEKHIAGISDNWLMFPVGSRYAYSNVGIDLAGYILQVRSGMPFVQYVQQKVLDPLGMKDSTLDVNRVRATTSRAIGHVGVPLRPPVDFLLIPSGGVWTSAADMARYLQFHINAGALDGKRLLREDLAATMYTPPNEPSTLEGYALGVTTSSRNGAIIIEHGGGGFGFISDMAWYPELKLGAVVLTNAHQSQSYAFQLNMDVLDHIIASNIPLFRQRYLNAAHPSPAYPAQINGNLLSNNGLRSLIQGKAPPVDAADLQRIAGYAGTYIISSFGFPGETFKITRSNGKLAWSYEGELSTYRNNGALTEVKPGLVFTENGSLFDLRGPVPMIDNIALVKADPQKLPLKIVLFVICGLVFLSALVFWPVRTLMRKIQKKSVPEDGASSPYLQNPWQGWAGALAVLASLFSLFCLVICAFVPNMVYFPWPQPFLDLLWWQFALFCLPFASLMLAGGLLLNLVLWIRRTTAMRGMRVYYLIVALGVLAFNIVILI